VRALGKARPETFDFIVSDPPYGVRQARRAPLSRFYKPLVVSLERALTDRGKIALIVLKRGTFLAALEQTHLRV
ncbi:MAG: hypothetical protein GWO04_46220, partial [Actinobacteria bacterium]|nr:hypothetical protein [Actinomycetota bacterium]